MGLDMWAFATSQKPGMPVDFGWPEDAQDFHTWRWHSDLHCWMEVLYWYKGGSNEQFNCVNLELSSGDIDRLEAAILADELPKSEGYSESSDSESDDDLAVGSERSDSQLDDDLAFITKVRDYLARGLTVYYTCWW
jgi:hypothetical protein